jgi:hypothetical protein
MTPRPTGARNGAVLIPDMLTRLEAEYLRPLGARLGRIVLGRKEYNGRIE